MCETTEGLKVKINNQDERIIKIENKIDKLAQTINDFILEMRTGYVKHDEFKEHKQWVYKKTEKIDKSLDEINIKLANLKILEKVVFALIGAVLMYVLNNLLALL